MKDVYYSIFNQCFPDMRISPERFRRLLQKEDCVYFEECDCDGVSAFAIVEGCAIRLICVTPAKQGHGIGTKLLSQIEQYAEENGLEKLITGGESSGLFIGATSESWGFFEKNGYESVGGCEEMLLSLKDFRLDRFALHGSDIAEYGWYNGDMEELRKVVALVDEGWPQYFSDSDSVYVARVNGEIASFCIVDVNSQNYLTDRYGKVGMPGCVGTVPKFRNKGIALEMIARVTEYLKSQGMNVSFIFYTGVADWYRKLGYETFLTECFGVKRLRKGEK